VTGDWDVRKACLTAAPPVNVPNCMGATATADLDVKGLVSYKADLTYSTMMTVQGSVVMTLPTSCLTFQGITLTCEQVNMGVMMAFMRDPDTALLFESIKCGPASGGCACTIVMKAQSVNQSGTYSVSGTQISMGTSIGPSSPASYCVSGDTLKLQGDTGASVMGGMSGMDAAGYLVLRKK